MNFQFKAVSVCDGRNGPIAIDDLDLGRKLKIAGFHISGASDDQASNLELC